MTGKITFKLLALGLLIAGAGYLLSGRDRPDTIRVGVLHSLRGTMAISERPVKEATLLAIEQINRSGGIDGRRIEPIIADGRSDNTVFAAEAERLIVKEQVKAIFGCWTSASRKTIRPIVEKYQTLLFYPVQYEGLESSPNIVYGSTTPHQQIVPAVRWSYEKMGPRFFMVGSDYIFPRAANAIIKSEAAKLGARVVGETYVALGETRVKYVAEQILDTRPDIIFNTLNGGTNRDFFRALNDAGITAERYPVMSFSVGENELAVIGAKIAEGHFASWSYFQSIDTENNRLLVQAFRKKFGERIRISDPMIAGYSNVYLWAWAVNAAGTDEPMTVLARLKGQRFRNPAGEITIDADNNHTWRTVRIGRVQASGQFEILWQSDGTIPPQPYPADHTPAQWEQFLSDLYRSWGNQWEKVYR